MLKKKTDSIFYNWWEIQTLSLAVIVGHVATYLHVHYDQRGWTAERLAMRPVSIN